jgi:GntR family transcriptional regulator/MocR family aminotransferase
MLSSKPVRILTVEGRPQPFASGLPDLQMFPFSTWARLMARHWRRPGYSLVGYGDPAGYRPLREAIAAYLRHSRAVRCEAEQVVIVTGSQQALDISARLLIDPGDTALLEDPGYPGARVALSAAGAELMRLPVDEEGANIAGIADGAAHMAFVTPSHQFPLGVTMSVARRLALLEWAERSGAWVLEDDYDSEYRYRGKPLPSLQGLDDTGRVIYVGSFSKTVFPSLRLGFLVLPPDLVEPFRRAHGVIDGHSPVTEQAVLADFIADGHYARHIRRMRAVYEERQAVLVDAAGRELKGLLEVLPSEGGMHLVGWLPKGIKDSDAAAKAAAHGVYVRPLSTCSVRKLSPGGLILGYAALSIPQIREGVRKLGSALAS